MNRVGREKAPSTCETYENAERMWSSRGSQEQKSTTSKKSQRRTVNKAVMDNVNRESEKQMRHTKRYGGLDESVLEVPTL